MAFIPDDAVDASHELTPTAFRLYCFICRRRNHKTGNAWIVPKVAANLLAVSTSQIYRAISELSLKEWIVTNDTTVIPIFGSFNKVDRSADYADSSTTQTVAPVRQIFAPVRQIFAPVRNHSYISSNNLNQPFNPDEPSAENKTQKTNCDICGKEICFSNHYLERQEEAEKHGI